MATGRIGTNTVLTTRWSKAPAGGTTSLSGLDDNSVSLVYSVGYEQVYRNGVLLSRGNDYTATNGTTITLIDATITGDIIEVFANATIPLTDTYSQTVANGKFINNTLTTTTGDIIYASAANTPARLGIGSTDQVLKVSGGIPAWATPAAGGGQNTRFPSTISGHYINSFISGSNSTLFTFSEDVTYYVPIILPTTTLDRINIKTSASHTGTSTVRLGIYASADTNKPGILVLDAGTVSCNASNTDFAVTISQAVDAGLYFVAINVQSLTGVASFVAVANGDVWNSSLFGFSTTALNGADLMRYIQTAVTGALPSPATITSLTANSVPAASVRIG